MRELEDQYKQSFRSIVEVKSFLIDMKKLVMTDREIRFVKGPDEIKMPTGAAILNALILWIEARPKDEQRRIVAEGMTRLNDLLRKDMAGDGPQITIDENRGKDVKKRGGRAM